MLLIQNGILHFADKAPQKGDILIKDKRIAKIGQNLPADGARVIDAGEKHVFPGFILPVTSVGITDYANLRRGDSDESPTPINADVHVRHSLDVREVALQGYRRSGITAFGASPAKNALIAGQMGVYHTHGRRVSEMCVKETAALKANFICTVKNTFTGRGKAPMTRMGMAALLHEALRGAKAYNPEKDDPDENKAVIARVLAGEIPLLINADLPGEIETVLSIANEFGIRVILHGGYTAHTLPQLLANGKTPLLLGDLQGEGAAVEYETDLAALIKMRENGLPLSLSNSGDGSAGHECLIWNAVRMVQAGLAPEEAARMLTIDAARILGVDNEIGSLAEGKYADISVFTHHPFETWRAAVDTFVVAGELVQDEKEGASCC